MRIIVFCIQILILTFPSCISAVNVTVNTEEELQSALDRAFPGDFILLGPSNFTGQFIASQNGTEESPITVLPNNEQTKIIGTGENGTIGFTVNGSFWNLKYIPVINFDTGVLLINGTGNVLDSLAIQNVSTGIMVNSSGNVLTSCAVRNATEVGIEVGNGAENTILSGNSIEDANLSINIEERTCCGHFKFNTVLGQIEVKGSNYTFEGNVFTGILNVTGCKNTFKEEVDMTPSFTKSCENPDLGGNTFI